MDLVIGRVVKPHGVRGELVVDIRTDDPELRFAPGTVVRGVMPRVKGAAPTAEREFTVTAARNHSGRLLVSLAGVSDRGAVDDLRGLLFVIDADDVDSGDDPDEFYDHELIGLPVRIVDGENEYRGQRAEIDNKRKISRILGGGQRVHTFIKPKKSATSTATP